MIQPTIIPDGDWNKFISENTGEHFLYCEGSYHTLITINHREDIIMHWIVDYYPDSNNRPKADYSIRREGLSYARKVERSEFFTYLKEKHPEHFEWALFNLNIML